MSVVNFLKSKIFWINITIALTLLIAIGFFAFRYLDKLTMHNEMIEVPDLSGISVKELEEYLSKQNLSYVIVDSVYDMKKQKSTVLDQDPPPFEKVKYNRTIYLTVNASSPPKIKMPNLLNQSLRVAVAKLESYGLMMGQKKYVPYYAKNNVMKQLADGKEIEPGALINKGSEIDLVVGDGLSNEQIEVPNLINMRRNEALAVLSSSALNIGAEVYDETVNDSAQARVYKQIPEAFNKISLGTSIDLFFTEDESKIKTDTDETEEE
jgi:eukaryotic-like serine/threonine-protein kinase